MNSSQPQLPDEDFLSLSYSSSNEKIPTAELISRWGTSASIALLDPACQIFTLPSIQGIIGYRTSLSNAVVFGDPLCHPEQIPSLVKGFHQFCQQKGWGVVYTVVSETFKKWALKHVCGASIEFGEELILDPRIDQRHGSSARKLRNKISHSLRSNVKIHEYLHSDRTLEEELEKVAESWLQSRRGPQVYLAHIDLFDEKIGKKWFYAKQNDRIVGILLLNRLDLRNGWLFNLLLTTPEAPHGTSELLVVSALEALARENCSYVTVGVVTKDQLGEMIGLGRFPTWLTQKGFLLAKKYFHLDSKKTYWKKFRPDSQRSYLLFSKPKIGIKQVLSVMRALNASI